MYVVIFFFWIKLLFFESDSPIFFSDKTLFYSSLELVSSLDHWNYANEHHSWYVCDGRVCVCTYFFSLSLNWRKLVWNEVKQVNQTSVLVYSGN